MRKHRTLRSSVAWVCLPIIVIFSTSSRITLPEDDGNFYAAWRRALVPRAGELRVGRLEHASDEEVFVGARVELVVGAAAQRSPIGTRPALAGTRLPSPARPSFSRRRASRSRGSPLTRVKRTHRSAQKHS